MKSKYFVNATVSAKEIIVKRVSKGSIVVDATIGNGNDTSLLAELVGKEGKVFGFDIQEIAIKNTTERLQKLNLFDRVQLYHDSHENIDKYIKDDIDLVIFNLGYLPGGDHTIITKPNSTIKAIKKSLELLGKNGILLVVVYSGHEGGEIEKEKIEHLLENLNQKQFDVLKYDFINQRNSPPVLIGVEKKG